MGRVRFTREGWYCLFVIVFVLGGAALREVNLLIVLAGLMIGPLVFHWRMATLMLRRIHVSRTSPARVRAGDVLTATITVENDRQRLDSWALVVQDRLALVGGGREDVARVRTLVPHVRARQPEEVMYEALLTRRGRYLLGPLQLSTRFPLGLIEARQKFPAPGHVIVCPRLGILTPQWRYLVQSSQLGSEQNRARKGLTEQGEFFGLREWRPGDAQRLVHWRTSAKLGSLAVRQFEQQRNPDLVLLLDLVERGEPRLAAETAISFAATIVDDLVVHGHTRLAIAIAGASTHCWSGLVSPLMADEIFDCLAEVQSGDGRQLKPAFQQLLTDRLALQSYERRTIVISTRAEQDLDRLLQSEREEEYADNRIWLNVSEDEQRRYFQLALDQELAV